MRDCLGRPIRSGPDDPPRKRLLSDDEITLIAQEVRTKPLAEVGRHVMPLIQHIVATEDKECRSCRFWVGYNLAQPHEGECLRPRTSGLSLRLLSEAGEDQTGEIQAALLTPFDWSCKGWEERRQDECEARCSPG